MAARKKSPGKSPKPVEEVVDAEFVETAPFYDPTQADWRGRYASARLSVTW